MGEFKDTVYKMNQTIEYSQKYYDKKYEYRHVTLPKSYRRILRGRGLLSED
jgi:hypothetical protein